MLAIMTYEAGRLNRGLMVVVHTWTICSLSPMTNNRFTYARVHENVSLGTVSICAVPYRWESDFLSVQLGALFPKTRITARVVGQVVQLLDELEDVVGQIFQRRGWL